MQGTACYAAPPPSQQVTMSASPGAGYVFQGWSGGCSGTSSTCVVAAKTAQTVSATFVPRGRKTVSLRMQRPRLSARWRFSVGKGTLLVRGAVGDRAKVRLELRRPNGGPLLFKRLTLRRGGFRIKQTLQKGRLLRGATLLPGGFVVVLRGRSGRYGLPLQIRTIALRAPGEGVVRTATVSGARNGIAVRRLPAGSTEAWATFKFSAQPRLAPLQVRWYQPNGRLLGTKSKNNRPLIKTGIGGSPIPNGTWRVDLVAGGKVVRRLNVRVG
jgi:uncharacterized repeat protein (TIGR02543 family)